MNDQTRAEACEELIDALPPTMSAGQRALEALAAYRAHDLPVPEHVLAEIDSCYSNFKQGVPDGGWVAEAAAGAAPVSLGEAFGIEPHAVGDATAAMRLRRKRAMMQPVLVAMFSGPHALKRTLEGYQEAARRTGLSAEKVERWLPKMRRNERGNRANRAGRGGGLAHNPFGI